MLSLCDSRVRIFRENFLPKKIRSYLSFLPQRLGLTPKSTTQTARGSAPPNPPPATQVPLLTWAQPKSRYENRSIGMLHSSLLLLGADFARAREKQNIQLPINRVVTDTHPNTNATICSVSRPPVVEVEF